jgi:hypothetical protein
MCGFLVAFMGNEELAEKKDGLWLASRPQPGAIRFSRKTKFAIDSLLEISYISAARQGDV